MKKIKIKLGLLSLLAILAASVFLTSCEQEAINIKTDKEIRNIVIAGMTKYPENASEAEMESMTNDYVESYKSLNQEEIIKYYEIRVEEIAKKYENDIAMQEEAKELLFLKIDINKLSLSKYNKPFNQITNEQLNEIEQWYFDEEEYSNNYIENKTEEEISKTSSCYKFYEYRPVNFLLLFSRGTSGYGCQFYQEAEDDKDCRWCCDDTYFAYPMANQTDYVMSNVNCHTSEVYTHLHSRLGYITQRNKDRARNLTGFVAGTWDAWGMKHTIKDNTSGVYYSTTCIDCSDCCL